MSNTSLKGHKELLGRFLYNERILDTRILADISAHAKFKFSDTSTRSLIVIEKELGDQTAVMIEAFA